MSENENRNIYVIRKMQKYRLRTIKRVNYSVKVVDLRREAPMKISVKSIIFSSENKWHPERGGRGKESRGENILRAQFRFVAESRRCSSETWRIYSEFTDVFAHKAECSYDAGIESALTFYRRAPCTSDVNN